MTVQGRAGLRPCAVAARTRPDGACCPGPELGLYAAVRVGVLTAFIRGLLGLLCYLWGL